MEAWIEDLFTVAAAEVLLGKTKGRCKYDEMDRNRASWLDVLHLMSCIPISTHLLSLETRIDTRVALSDFRKKPSHETLDFLEGHYHPQPCKDSSISFSPASAYGYRK